MVFFLGCRPRVLGGLCGFLCVAASALGQTQPAPAEDPSSSPLFASAEDYFNLQPEHKVHKVRLFDVPRYLLEDQRSIWTSPTRIKKSDLRWIVPLAAATGLLIGTDHHTATLIHNDAANRSRSTTVADGGMALFGGIAAASYSFGAFTRDEHKRETGILMAEAAADATAVAEGLKLVTQRERPLLDSGQGSFWRKPSLDSSFPSEHAAFAWAAAAVLAREYPGPVTTWSAYGLASIISFARISSSAHFPSDVLVGAAAGYLIGRYVYNAHHDDKISDQTGSTPVFHWVSAVARAAVKPRDRDSPTGSVYVPLDSWVYPTLRRLAALGYIPDQISDSAPWTRLECLHQVDEASELASMRVLRNENSSAEQEALRLLADLRTEFASATPGGGVIGLESIYSRVTDIQGAPLRDSYHFGQTLTDDYGRPYGQGLNNITGFSTYASAGRFSAYVRGEYEEAPGAPAYGLPVRQFIAAADANPLQPARPIESTNRFEPLEAYAGVQLGLENITFGKQALWWGPGEESAFSFSDNAAPFYMLRLAQTRPLVLPGPFAWLGHIRTEFIFGKLSGHQWPPRPYMNAQKITLDVTKNLEFGFTRSAFFGGVGHPLTFGTLEQDFSSFGSTGRGYYGDPTDPGDRHSGFDFRWRVPGLRRYLTVYSDSYADDDPSPLDNPRRAAWGPGLYIAQLPGLRKLDLRFETYSTWLYRKDYGGQFIYYNNQYHDAYTNDGYLLGSWVGRDARAYTAEAAYWIGAKTKILGGYRQTKAGTRFLPGGGTQTDVSITAQWSFRPQWLVGSEVQYERYYIPVLGGPAHDTLASLQITFYPRDLAWPRQAH